MNGLKIKNLRVTYDKKCKHSYRNMFKQSINSVNREACSDCQNNHECMRVDKLDKNKYFDNKNLNKSVIDNFNVDIQSGELIVILGNSGCGKSTLLSAISGLKVPEEGSILFEDEIFFDSNKKIDIATEKRNIGFCFQSYALWPHMTVEENIAFPLKNRKMSKKNINEKVKWILEIVELLGYEDRYPNELSGGEKQRVALARSLVYDPKLLLLDEPLANLDAKLKKVLVKKIREIHDKLNLTTIYVTHDQNEAFEIADRIIIMKHGKIMQIGNPVEVYQNPSNMFVSNFIGQNNFLSYEDMEKLNLHDRKKDMKNSKLSIRPEKIMIYKDEKNDNSNILKGIVSQISFHGDYTDYIISINNINLQVREFASDVKNKGDEVCVKFT